jgi:hypothetical protein
MEKVCFFSQFLVISVEFFVLLTIASLDVMYCSFANASKTKKML